MSLSLSLAGVEAGALQNDVDAQLAPGAILSILNSVDGDLLAVDDDVILASLNGVLVPVSYTHLIALAALAADGLGIVVNQGVNVRFEILSLQGKDVMVIQR